MSKNVLEWVTKNEVKERKDVIREMLQNISEELKGDNKPGFCVGVFGSAKRNMVLKIGKKVWDVDFQLFVSKKELAAEYRKEIFDILKKKLDESTYKIKNSTSVITIKKLNEQEKPIKSFDIALILLNWNKNDAKKAILKKDNSDWVWEGISNSEKITEKLKKVEKNDVRKQYKKLKEKNWDKSFNLKKNSYSLFIEAVNNVYNNKK